MITAIVFYKYFVDGGGISNSGYYVSDYKIVEVEKLTDINGMFHDITDVKVINRQ